MSNEQARLLEQAFLRSLNNYLGPIEEKPIPELRAWASVLLDLARDYRERQFELEELLHDKRTFGESALPPKYDPTFPHPEIGLDPNAH